MALLYYLKDALEILFFSGIIYTFSCWLAKDKQNNLLIYFYSYCTLFSGAYLFHLPIIATFLLYAFPFSLILLVIFHQEILQKNFISLRSAPIIATHTTGEWAEHLIRASLHAINNNKQLLCVIQNGSDLKPFLDTGYIFNSPICQNILTLLIDSPAYNPHKMFWCTAQGTIIGINSSWNITHYDMPAPNKDILPWQQDALLMTLKTDTLVFHANPTSRTFDLVTKGVLYKALSATQVLAMIKKQIILLQPSQGDGLYDAINKNHTLHQ